MFKRIVSMVLLVSTVCLLMTACNVEDSLEKWLCSFDDELHGKITFVTHNDDGHHIEYEGQKYIWESDQIFAVSENVETDVLLGWNGLGYINHYYSNTNNDPLYIYERRLDYIYFRDDYDYKSDTYRIGETDYKVILSDVLKETDFAYSPLNRYEGMTIFTMYSEQIPCLSIEWRVFQYENSWYLIGRSGTEYKVTDEFVDLLDQNEIITRK